MPDAPLRQRPLDVLVAGGGPAGIEAALALREEAPRSARVRLLCPDESFVYRPLSVVEPFTSASTRRYPLERLGERGIDVAAGRLVAVDAAARTATTGAGETLTYDALVVAAGARTQPVLPHATTFTGSEDSEAMRRIVSDIDTGWCKHVTFVAPFGARWTVPLYELALQTAERAADRSLELRITLVTHERRPLGVFGPGAAIAVDALLREAGIETVTWAGPAVPKAGVVEIGPGRPVIECDHVVALPVPVGRAIAGLPGDDGGFLPVDGHGRVEGLAGVYGAGDGTSHVIKQGGLATQQAAVAVSTLLADAGLRATPGEYNPVLRAMLLAGRRTLFLRREGAEANCGTASFQPLWWPPTKIAGHHLAPFLDEIDAEDPDTQIERRRVLREGPIRRRAIIAAVPGEALT